MSAIGTKRTLVFCNSVHWVKVKTPKAPWVKREAEEDWGRT
jgi:hypothetical protein